MKPPRRSPQHCRCTRRTACGRRFKGIPGETLCPHCGAASRLDKWAASKPWKQPDKMCRCDGYEWGESPHRLGSPKCLGLVVPIELPGVELDL